MGAEHDFTYRHYKQMLTSAIDNGYRFVDFSKLPLNNGRRELACSLRHDCDNDMTAALSMASIEREVGVRSTYFVMLRSAMYNLLNIPNREIVQQIMQMGHEVGLHFDERCYPTATPSRISDYMDVERRIMSELFDIAVNIVSFHQPSERVLKNEIRVRCLNTYSFRNEQGIRYVSDTNMEWIEGCPCGIFQDRRYHRLQLLIHPEWWTEKEMSILGKWHNMFLNNFALSQQSLLSRERSYQQLQKISFRAVG